MRFPISKVYMTALYGTVFLVSPLTSNGVLRNNHIAIVRHIDRFCHACFLIDLIRNNDTDAISTPASCIAIIPQAMPSNRLNTFIFPLPHLSSSKNLLAASKIPMRIPGNVNVKNKPKYCICYLLFYMLYCLLCTVTPYHELSHYRYTIRLSRFLLASRHCLTLL